MDSLNTVMYEKKKTSKIIAYFEVFPLETGLFDHVLNLLNFTCSWGSKPCARFCYLFK